MGAQKDDPDGRNYDPLAEIIEFPVHEITLDPFFLSKYEMTQHQWVVGSRRDDWIMTKRDTRVPVGSVSWDDADSVLPDLLLELPTEAQWEYAARAGTTTPWHTGADPVRVYEFENLFDEATREFRDPAVVGSLRANPFGLHDVLGNLNEICRDGRNGVDEYKYPVAPGTGERLVEGPTFRVIRGGSCWIGPRYARVSIRAGMESFVRFLCNGLRPVREIRE